MFIPWWLIIVEIQCAVKKPEVVLYQKQGELNIETDPKGLKVSVSAFWVDQSIVGFFQAAFCHWEVKQWIGILSELKPWQNKKDPNIF